MRISVAERVARSVLEERISAWLAGEADGSELEAVVRGLAARFVSSADALTALAEVIATIETRAVDNQADAQRRSAAPNVRDVLLAVVRPASSGPDDPADRDEAIDGRIDALLNELNAADALTAEHSRAVGSWCARIASRLGIDREGALFARRAGLLHDIGKLHIPSDILSARRSLNAQEWVVMRRHTELGLTFVEADERLRPFAEAIRSHHERIDGTGYPDSVPATTLSITVRIVSVADSFNAMIGNRPYRRPLRPVEALDEVVRFGGRQFDPEVVEALVATVTG